MCGDSPPLEHGACCQIPQNCSFCLACHRHPDYADTMLVLVSSPGVREQIKAADMIVVFEDGVLLEQGTHDALVNDGGLYAQLAGHKSTRD